MMLTRLHLFLRHFASRKSVPFDARVPNEETRRAVAELDQGDGERFDGSAEELFEKVIASRK
jgi:antitoxin component of RelBE/YafQ-DinJ toxin-antitoxin module